MQLLPKGKALFSVEDQDEAALPTWYRFGRHGRHRIEDWEIFYHSSRVLLISDNHTLIRMMMMCARTPNLSCNGHHKILTMLE